MNLKRRQRTKMTDEEREEQLIDEIMYEKWEDER